MQKTDGAEAGTRDNQPFVGKPAMQVFDLMSGPGWAGKRDLNFRLNSGDGLSREMQVVVSIRSGKSPPRMEDAQCCAPKLRHDLQMTAPDHDSPLFDIARLSYNDDALFRRNSGCNEGLPG